MIRATRRIRGMSLFFLLMRMLLVLTLVTDAPGVASSAAAASRLKVAQSAAVNQDARSYSIPLAWNDTRPSSGCHDSSHRSETVSTGIQPAPGWTADRPTVAAAAHHDSDCTDCCVPVCNRVDCSDCLASGAADVAGLDLKSRQAVPHTGTSLISVGYKPPVLSGVFRPPIG